MQIEVIERVNRIMKEKTAKFIHEMIEELILDGILCSFLGENWMSFADYFKLQSTELKYASVSNEEKVRMIFLSFKDSPENISIEKLIAYLNKINY